LSFPVFKRKRAQLPGQCHGQDQPIGEVTRQEGSGMNYVCIIDPGKEEAKHEPSERPCSPPVFSRPNMMRLAANPLYYSSAEECIVGSTIYEH
jgi:hypothetical protein